MMALAEATQNLPCKSSDSVDVALCESDGSMKCFRRHFTMISILSRRHAPKMAKLSLVSHYAVTG